MANSLNLNAPVLGRASLSPFHEQQRNHRREERSRSEPIAQQLHECRNIFRDRDGDIDRFDLADPSGVGDFAVRGD